MLTLADRRKWKQPSWLSTYAIYSPALEEWKACDGQLVYGRGSAGSWLSLALIDSSAAAPIKAPRDRAFWGHVSEFTP
jgi:hypothetical protein